jgi:hypothetical protein
MVLFYEDSFIISLFIINCRIVVSIANFLKLNYIKLIFLHALIINNIY